MGELRVFIPDQLHRALKFKALKEGKTLKKLVTEILEKGVKDASSNSQDK